MPLKRCSENKKSGWKWGDSGKCYTGPEGKKKAIRQGISIEGPERFKEKARSVLSLDDSGDLTQAMLEEKFSMLSIASILYGLRSNLL
jgi:hypothetical protein